MARPLRFVLALGAFFVLAGLLAACGNSVPGNAVVRVGDSLVKRSDFNHWLGIAARMAQPPGTAGATAVPDAPSFAKCIAAKRQSTPRAPQGQPQLSDAQFKAQCQQEYDSLRDQVLQFLIQAKWLQGEADDQGIKVTPKDVQTAFQQQKKQSFSNEADYRRFLATSGQTEQDLLLQIKLGLLSNKIRDKVTKGKDKVTEKQLIDYYAKNKQRFAQPERRNLLVVLTKTAARAQQAKRAIAGGQPWAKVAKRFSVDQSSKAKGGQLLNILPGQQEQALDTAVFHARPNQLVGPVKTQFGYYVFKVTNVTPPSQQPLSQVRDAIRRVLMSQNQQQALNKFVQRFQKKWKSQTNCRKGFVVALCENAPKPPRTSTVPPGAVPQGGAPPGVQQPQGAPPQGAPPQGAVPPQQAPPVQP